MGSNFELSSSIRWAAKTIAWITAFTAPITGIYSYVHSGNLAAQGITTQLNIWGVLWNLSINFGYLMLIYGVIFYLSIYVVVLPLGFVIALATSSLDKIKNDDRFTRNLLIADAIIIFFLTWPFLLGGIVVSFDPQKHTIIDELFGVVGAIYLLSLYWYIFMSATGKFEDKKPSESNT